MPFVNGRPEWPPTQQHVAFGDPVAGLYGAAAALVGLFGRARLGGVDIDLCQVECLFQLGAAGLIAEHAAGAPYPRAGNRARRDGALLRGARRRRGGDLAGGRRGQRRRLAGAGRRHRPC